MTPAALLDRRDAEDQRAREGLALYAPDVADADSWFVFRTTCDEELYQQQTWSPSAALAFLLAGCRLERAPA